MVGVCQRWRTRRDSYRPAREVVSTRSLEVAPIADDRTARAFVVEHHYSGSYPAARFRFGLFDRGRLVGVAVYSVPCSDRVITSCLPGDARESVELRRFVLLDAVGANGETWMLGRCHDYLRREGLVGVVSYSDPLPRATADGAVVFGDTSARSTRPTTHGTSAKRRVARCACSPTAPSSRRGQPRRSARGSGLAVRGCAA